MQVQTASQVVSGRQRARDRTSCDISSVPTALGLTQGVSDLRLGALEEEVTSVDTGSFQVMTHICVWTRLVPL